MAEEQIKRGRGRPSGSKDGNMTGINLRINWTVLNDAKSLAERGGFASSVEVVELVYWGFRDEWANDPFAAEDSEQFDSVAAKPKKPLCDNKVRMSRSLVDDATQTARRMGLSSARDVIEAVYRSYRSEWIEDWKTAAV